MKAQLKELSYRKQQSINILLTRLIQEQLELNDLWPPPAPIPKPEPQPIPEPPAYVPKPLEPRKLSPNPHSIFTDAQLGKSFEPETLTPEQAAFLAESQQLTQATPASTLPTLEPAPLDPDRTAPGDPDVRGNY
jgi:hypothetical protein